MTGRTRRNQRAVFDKRPVKNQRLSGYIGHQAAGFMHQQVRRGQVPVMATGRGESGVEFPLCNAGEPQRQGMHLGLWKNFRVQIEAPLSVAPLPRAAMNISSVAGAESAASTGLPPSTSATEIVQSARPVI
jgi:hypothetical protein